MLTSRSIPIARTSSTSLLSHSQILSRSFAKIKDVPQRFADEQIDPRLMRSSREHALPPQASLPKPSFFRSQSAKQRREAREGGKQSGQSPPPPSSKTASGSSPRGKINVESEPDSKVSLETLRKWDNRKDFREYVRDDVRKRVSPSLLGSRKTSVESAILHPTQPDSAKYRAMVQNAFRPEQQQQQQQFPESGGYDEEPRGPRSDSKKKMNLGDDVVENLTKTAKRSKLFGQSNATRTSPKFQDKPPRIPQAGLRKGQKSLRALTQDLYDSSNLNLDLEPKSNSKSKKTNPFFEGTQLKNTLPKQDTADPDSLPEWQKAKTIIPPGMKSYAEILGKKGGIDGMKKTKISDLERQGLKGLNRLPNEKPDIAPPPSKKKERKERNEKKAAAKARNLKLKAPLAQQVADSKAPVPTTPLQVIAQAIQQFEYDENPNQVPQLGEIWEKKFRHLGLLRIGQMGTDQKLSLFKKGRDLTLDSIWEFLKMREFLVPNTGTEKVFKMRTVDDFDWKWGKVPEGTKSLFVFTSEEEKKKFANFYKLFDQGFEAMSAVSLAKAVEKEHQTNSKFTRLVIDAGSPFALTFTAKEFPILASQSSFLLLDRILATLTANPTIQVPDSLYRYFLYTNFFLIVRPIQDISADKKLKAPLKDIVSQLYYTKQVNFRSTPYRFLFVFTSYYDAIRYLGWKETESLNEANILCVKGKALVDIILSRSDLNGATLNPVTKKKLNEKGETSTSYKFARLIQREVFEIPQFQLKEMLTLPNEMKSTSQSSESTQSTQSTPTQATPESTQAVEGATAHA